MDRDVLERMLAEGMSLEAIGRAVGKHPSTVGYWVNKHGLASAHAAKHAARGGIARDELSPLVEMGLSIREIAHRLDVSYATVRHWLDRHEMTTPRARRLAETAAARAAGEPLATATCDRHGVTVFGRRAEGGYRCLRCRSEAVVARRRRVKLVLIEEAGGACALCGYDRSPVALQFHHREPDGKKFGIADGGMARSLERAREEAAKCVLLCANCHAEVEAGIATLPTTGPPSIGPG